jgi:LPXTG-motif cell wall-anchored protein
LSTSFIYTSDSVEVVFGFKPIVVDSTFVSDERADVGSVQTVGFHVSWMNNGSDVKGASVYVNGTEYVTNMTGWASFDVSCDVACKTVWNVTGVEVDEMSVYAKAVGDPFIVWDRINVTDVTVIDELVQAGSVKTVWLTAEYEYDSNVFDDTKGTMYLNGEPMTWSSQNMRWEQTLTSNVLGPIVYEATDVDDKVFRLTTIHKNGRTTTITWDKIEVAKTEFDSTTIGETVARVYVAFSYSKTPIGNATVFVNDKPCTETEPGTYTCTLEGGFSPIESFDINATVANFEQTTVTVSSIQFSNTILYTLIGAAVLLLTIFFVKKRKRRQNMKISG